MRHYLTEQYSPPGFLPRSAEGQVGKQCDLLADGRRTSLVLGRHTYDQVGRRKHRAQCSVG